MSWPAHACRDYTESLYNATAASICSTCSRSILLCLLGKNQTPAVELGVDSLLSAERLVVVAFRQARGGEDDVGRQLAILAALGQLLAHILGLLLQLQGRKRDDDFVDCGGRADDLVRDVTASQLVKSFEVLSNGQHGFPRC